VPQGLVNPHTKIWCGGLLLIIFLWINFYTICFSPITTPEEISVPLLTPWLLRQIMNQIFLSFIKKLKAENIKLVPAFVLYPLSRFREKFSPLISGTELFIISFTIISVRFFERLFINDSYSCRKGRGTSYGIKRLNHFIRSCSDNYKRDCYILKLDIKGYFMAIDHSLLYQKVEKILNRFRREADFDVDLILSLIHQVIFHDHTKHCCLKGRRSDWQGLPKTKSLFYAEKNKGLPIGNLTSQLFGNVYLNDFDYFVKHKLGCKYYGRYVDDFVIVHQDKEYLKSIIPLLKEYLQNELSPELHSEKIYLQHFSKGVFFLGVIIKPYRIYIRNQTKGNFYKKIKYWNNFLAERQYKLNEESLKQFLSSVNSYLGIMKHYNTYNLRKRTLIQNLSAYFWNHVYISNNYSKLVSKKKRV